MQMFALLAQWCPVAGPIIVNVPRPGYGNNVERRCRAICNFRRAQPRQELTCSTLHVYRSLHTGDVQFSSVLASFVGATLVVTARASRRVGCLAANEGGSYSDKDAECLADGTPISTAGNAAFRKRSPPLKQIRPASVAPEVAYLADGTAVNRAGNAINHPESIKPDTHVPGLPLPPSAYIADMGCLADGTPIDLAGNRSLKRATSSTIAPSQNPNGVASRRSTGFVADQPSKAFTSAPGSRPRDAEGSGTTRSGRSLSAPLAVQGMELQMENKLPTNGVPAHRDTDNLNGGASQQVEMPPMRVETEQTNTNPQQKAVADAPGAALRRTLRAEATEPSQRPVTIGARSSSTTPSSVIIDVDTPVRAQQQRGWNVGRSEPAAGFKSDNYEDDEDDEDASEELLAVTAFVASALFVNASVLLPGASAPSRTDYEVPNPAQPEISASSSKGLTGVALNFSTFPFMGT